MCFLTVFMLFSLILESFRLPFGSLWASLFTGISDLLQDGWQSRLQDAKRNTFLCFWPPFGRIVGDILEGLGSNLNTLFLAMPGNILGVFSCFSSRMLSLGIP